MKKFVSILILFFSYAVFGQGEANNWYFGINAGIKFNGDGTVSLLNDSKMNTNEGCSTMSDGMGNLLFYTDGSTVWDRNHKVMPNANYIFGTGLLGDPSSTQSGIIVPKKNDPNVYYIFTVDEPHHENAAVYPNQFLGPYVGAGSGTVPADDDGFNNGLNYSVVDLSVTGSNGSIGDVVTRNVHLQTYNPLDPEQVKYKCSEKITAVKNADGSGFWVITQFVDSFYAFKVDATGVNPTPVITNIIPFIPTSGYRRNSIGCIKASPDGKKLAIAHNQVGTVEGGSAANGIVYLYDFDSATGQVSNPVKVSENLTPYGIEFSREVKKLYVSYSRTNTLGLDGVVQYNLEATDVAASAITVNISSPGSGALQLGPNGKIYKAVNGGTFLDVIENPEADGTDCNYLNSAQPIGGPSGRRAIFGLPPFITSLFSASIIATNSCLGQTTALELNVSSTFDSVVWDFGDSTPTSTATRPLHTYATAGTYNVTATVTKDGETTVISTPIIVSAVPVANTAPAITKCDTDNNGSESFDLTANSAAVRGTQSATDFDVKYYTSQANADADTGALNATSYTNILPAETIFARIYNKANPNCYATTSFTIAVSPTPTVTATAYAICDDDADGDDNNGQATFTMQAVAQHVVPNVADVTFAFYESLTDAINQVSPLPAQFYNTTAFQQDVFIRLQSVAWPTCSLVHPITLKVNALPVPTAPVTLVQCDLGAAPDGITQFNLAEANQQLTSGNAGLTVRYFTSDASAQSGTGELSTLYTNTANPQQITARIQSDQTGCYRTAQVTLQVNFSAVPVVTIEVCDEDTDGTDERTEFDLDAAGLATGTNTVAYYLTESDALAEQNPLAPAYSNTSQNQVVFARIENNNDCVAIQQIKLVVRRLPDIDTTGEGIVCLNRNTPITLTSGLQGSTNGYAFLWSTLETSPTIQVTQPGIYTVKVTDMSNSAGCSRTRTITVTASDIARITDVEILDLRDDNIVTVTAVPNTPGVATTYLYSLDMPDGPYQASNVFENVSAGFHTVYVYNEQECGIAEKDITVLEIPKFFTPNADGVNDTWNIIGVNALFYKNSKIYIFDRFGKLLADVNPRGEGWDGLHDGRKLPATDYWYVVQLDNGRTVKGHFSLLR